LRCFDAELDALNAIPIFEKKLPFDPTRFFSLFGRIAQVSAVRERVTMGLAIFKSPFLKRRSYVKKTSQYFDDFLGIPALEGMVQEKVKALTQAIETGFRTITGIIALIVSLVALLFTVMRFFGIG
jgi:hypothetical protein